MSVPLPTTGRQNYARQAEEKASARQIGHFTARNQAEEGQDDVSPILRSVLLKDETINEDMESCRDR